MSRGALGRVLLRLTTGVTRCTLGLKHLPPEVLASQIGPLDLLITGTEIMQSMNCISVKFGCSGKPFCSPLLTSVLLEVVSF